MPHTPPAVDAVLESLSATFGPVDVSTFRGQTRVVVPVEKALEAFRHLAGAGFDLLVDVTCVDYLDYKGAKHRYGLVYLLADTATNQRLTVRVFVDDPEPTVPSVTPIWEGADWLEREVWDL
ncbi:MAG: NADH-quinone oxidoreductase subunit C, partial [Planctomycetia bacterium]|nr:NADH-quinone oxidoreductase subunit C [Planctomycetia bacterium]